jgi:archaellum component FlaC
MSEEQGMQVSDNSERISKLRSQLEDVMSKREELSAELNTMTQIALKLQGAIEVLEGIDDESEQKKEEKGD